VSVTVVPTSPLEGLNVNDCVTVNDWGALSTPVAASSPARLWGPSVSLGTLNVHWKPPDASVVINFPEWEQSDPPVGVWITELKNTHAPEDKLNPDPVTV
jgi:hypothetical protein